MYKVESMGGGECMVLSAEYVKAHLPARRPQAHKGDFGKVYCVCGSVGYTGAPVFAARSAVRTGSGLVYLGVPQDIWQIAAVKSDEAMVFPLPCKGGKLSLTAESAIRAVAAPCDAVLLGCGLGRSDETDALLRRLLDLKQPLVLDADGINALSGHIDSLTDRKGITVLTPHEGEFLRLATLAEGREASARRLAVQTGCYVVLKGHHTIVAAPDGRTAQNPTGNNGMAKGGSGDVLAGMVLSLLGQGMPPFEACCCGVYLHGLAGDLAAAEKTTRAMTPTDLLEKIPDAYKEILG